MKLNHEKLKQLLEAGDTAALEAEVKASIEKTDIYPILTSGDIELAAAVNGAVLSDLDSLKDKHYNKAFSKYETEKLPALLDAAKQEGAASVSGGQETPIEKEVRELRESIQKQKVKTAQAELRNQIISLATSEDVKLDSAFVTKHINQFIPTELTVNEAGEIDLAATLEAVKPNITGLATDINTLVQTQLTEALKGAALGGAPGGGVQGAQGAGETLGAKIAKMSQHKSANEAQTQFFK